MTIQRRWLRWGLVPPAAVGGLLLAVLLSAGVLVAGLWLVAPPSVDWLPVWLLIVPWFLPGTGFVVGGALAAPARKTITGMVFTFLYAFFAGEANLVVVLMARLTFYGGTLEEWKALLCVVSPC